MLSFQNITLFVTILCAGLVAGLLYSYSCSVNPGLNALTDVEYLRAMQSINKAILNPYFFASFMGLLILFPLATWQQYSQQQNHCFYLMLAATLIYFAGVMGVTLFGNVPLNDKLAVFNIGSSAVEEVKAMRLAFEAPWNKLHLLRTLAAILSFSICLVAIIKNKL